MQCPQCQHANRAGAKFCDECGMLLTGLCYECGTTNPHGATFCQACGAVLSVESSGSGAVQSVIASHLVSPQAYTPRHLAEKILTARSALEGERKQVTVLFGDIADSSGLAQQLGPESMYQLLDQVLRLMAEAVHRYEGTVNQYLGDGVMALFGAPVALEDHAFRAVQAALTIQETISGYSAQFERDHGVTVHLRMGLNTGPVVVGRIGDDLRMDYTAVGNTTNLASRIQSLAKPGTILLTQHTYRLVEGHIRSEALGAVEVKGQRQPVEVYKVTGRRQWRSQLEMSAERGLTQFVGRQRELVLLHDCLARVEAGHRQIVGIVGEAGLGKSRLLYEFHTSLTAGRVRWLEGHCLAHGQRVPYGPVLDILRANFHIEEGDNSLQIRDKLRRGVRRLDPSLEPTLPFLESLFGISDADYALRHLDPKDKRQRILEAIRALGAVGSQRRPHVLVWENLHWIDQSSEACLTFLNDTLPQVPTLVLTTHRPGYTVPWKDKPYYTQITLDLLTEAELEVMMATLLRSPRVPPGLRQFIQEKTDGNPLFVEEVVRALMERGLLRQHNDDLQWGGDAEITFPATVQDIIQARIDRLNEPVKRTVQMAAVIGREFDLRLLTRLSHTPAAVPEHLEMLRQMDLIHEACVFPELAYCFKHVVIQDVTYQSLLGRQRRAIHTAIGAAIEELYADQLAEHAVVLAHHYALSEHPHKVMTYALLAGDQAARLYANAEASTYYKQALTIAQTLPPTPEAHGAQIEATLKLATVGSTRADFERDQHNLEQARTLAETLADEPQLARVFYWLGRLAYVRGAFRTAIDYAEQSLAIADKLGDETLAAPPVNLMGRGYYLMGDYVRASHLLARSVEQMRYLGNMTEEATAAGFAGVAFAAVGEFERALSYANHGLRLAQELHNPFVEAAAYNYQAVAYCHQGAGEQAIASCEAARRVAERAGDRFRVYLVQYYEGYAYAMLGNPQRGRELLEDSIALASQLGTTTLLAWGKGLLVMCLLALAEDDTVLSLCHEAITLAQHTHDRLANALAHRLLAEVVAIQHPVDVHQAENAICEAIRIQQELSSQPELARSYVSYARLLQQWGRNEAAQSYLLQAITLFQHMGMLGDLTQAQEALRALV